MATMTVGYTAYYPSQQQSIARAHVSITLTYATSQSNTAVTISASNISVGAISTTGTEGAKDAAKRILTNQLSSMTARFLINGGATIVSKTGFAPSSSYAVSGSTSVNRDTSAKSVVLNFYCNNSYQVATINIPARQSWSVTYNANSGSGAPSTQTKYYGYNLTLSGGRPNKTDHTFLGWATSAARAGTTPPSIDYNPGQTYSGNAALALYAIWKRNYTKPALSNLKVDRCALNQQGEYELDDEGGYAQVTFQWSVFRTEDALYYGGSNKAYADNSIKEDECVITVGGFTVTATPTGQSGTYTAYVGDGTFDTDTAYPVTVSITDTQEVVADNTTTITGELSKAKFPIDINSTATAIAFLSTAPDDDEGVFCPDMTAQEVQDFVDNLEGGGGTDFTRIKRELLWTNATSPFASQTVSLALSEYDYVEVWFGSLITVDAMLPNPLLIPLGERREIVVFHALGDGGANENTGMRGVTVSATGVTFGDYNYKNRRTGGGLTKANQFAVPNKIYGVKYY